MRLCFVLTSAYLIFSFAPSAWGQLPVFPGAQGFGADTRAAYGAANHPVLCVVTTPLHREGQLSGASDTSAPDGTKLRNAIPVAEGSFLECLRYVPPPNTGKVVLFEVSGTIWATSPPYEYRVDHPNTIVAGQTAPSPGVTLRNIHFMVRDSDILVQHLRSRVGDALAGSLPRDRRSITIMSTSQKAINNVVADHITATWGVDTCATVWETSANEASNITISNSIIAEGLHHSIHPDGHHSKGLALQVRSERISAIGNLIMSNDDRNPYVRWGSKVLVNNVIYNVLTTNISVNATDGTTDLAAVGNVVLAGPLNEGHTGWSNRGFVRLDNDPVSSSNWDASRIYFLDNLFHGVAQASSSDWSTVLLADDTDDVGPYKIVGESPQTDAPLWPAGFTAMPSVAVQEHIIAHVGARPAQRDGADLRLIDDLRNTTGGLIDSPDDVGGWPALVEKTRTLDSGMTAEGLPPIPSSPHADSDGDGYANLEEWLHLLAAHVEGRLLDCATGPVVAPCICQSVLREAGHCCDGMWQPSSCEESRRDGSTGDAGSDGFADGDPRDGGAQVAGDGIGGDTSDELRASCGCGHQGGSSAGLLLVLTGVLLGSRRMRWRRGPA